MVKKEKYKSGRITNTLIIITGVVALFGWFFAIWIPEYRWRIFFTSLVCLILVLLIVSTDKDLEKKWEEKQN